MNFALPGILIILGIVPGILFFNGYYSGKFPRQIAQFSPVAELAQYLVFAIPLDALVIWLFPETSEASAFETILQFLTNSPALGQAGGLSDTMGSSWWTLVSVYLIVVVVAYGLGTLLRHVVWAFRLDLRVPFLRFTSSWYYELQGRRKDLPRWLVLPYADVLADHPDGSRLYRGLVVSFEVDRSGGVSRLALNPAYRGKGRGKDFEWSEIPGDRLILMGDSIHSINMHYIQVEPELFQKKRLAKLGLWFRSLVFQEP